ncbi:hypothetical protein ACHAQJ_005508 [Trichoderma viride]
MPRLTDEVGDFATEELFTPFFGDAGSANSSHQASPPYPLHSSIQSPAVSATYRFASLVHSPVFQSYNSVRSPARSSLIEPLNAIGDKSGGPMQSKDGGRLSSAPNEPKPSSRLRSTAIHKAGPKPAEPPSSVAKRELRPRGKTEATAAVRKVGRPVKTEAKGGIRKVGRPAKTAATPRKKRTVKEDGATTAVQGGRKEWEVEQIVDSRIDEETLQHWFKVKWKGYTSKHNTWEPKKNLANCKTLVEKYEEKAGK